jgi:rubrerythrin
MSVLKSIADVFAAAVRIERQGIVFYNKRHRQSLSTDAGNVFSVLAAEEEMHAGLFRKLLTETAGYTPRYDYLGEYGMLLNECAASVLKAVTETESVTTDFLSTAFDTGIAFEKETILFCLELSEEGSFSGQNAFLIKRPITEERTHLKELVALKRSMIL